MEWLFFAVNSCDLSSDVRVTGAERGVDVLKNNARAWAVFCCRTFICLNSRLGKRPVT